MQRRIAPGGAPGPGAGTELARDAVSAAHQWTFRMDRSHARCLRVAGGIAAMAILTTAAGTATLGSAEGELAAFGIFKSLGGDRPRLSYSIRRWRRTLA